MIGWRAKLGVLVPSANSVLEPDMYRMAPQGVSVHFSRVVNYEDTPEQLEAMIQYVPRCCEKLSHARMDVYAFGCTGGSLMGGLGYDQKMIKIMQEKTGKPATTTSTAVIEAFREMGIGRVCVVTPYEDWLNERQKNSLKPAACGCAGHQRSGHPGRESKSPGLRPGKSAPLQAREINKPEAPRILMSCTNFRAAEVLEIIEKDLGKPAISSNQATLWAMLKLVGIKGMG